MSKRFLACLSACLLFLSAPGGAGYVALAQSVAPVPARAGTPPVSLGAPGPLADAPELAAGTLDLGASLPAGGSAPDLPVVQPPAAAAAPTLPFQAGPIGPVLRSPASDVWGTRLGDNGDSGRPPRSERLRKAAASIGALAASLLGSWGMLMGSVQPQDEPPSNDMDRFMAQVQKTYGQPGAQLTQDFLRALCSELDAGPAEVRRMADHLAAQGRLAAFSNGALLYVDLARASPMESEEALASARTGLGFLNKGRHRIKALVKLDSAIQEYDKAGGGSLRGQLELLKDNAALELLRQVLKEGYSRLAGKDESADRRRAIERLVEQIDPFVFDAAHARLALSADSMESLRSFMAEMSPAKDAAGVEEIRRGIELLRRFVDDSGKVEAMRALPASPISAGMGERFLAEISRRLKPGQRLSLSEQTDIGRGLGLRQSDTWPLIGELAKRGHLATFTNATNIFVDFAGNGDPSLEGLNGPSALARDAVRLSAGEGAAEKARALHFLDEAVARYPSGYPHRRQVAILRDNAAIDLLANILGRAGAHEGDLEWEALKKLDKYLMSAYRDVNQALPRMSMEDVTAAKDLLAKFDASQFESGAHSEEILDGLGILHMWVDDMEGPGESGSPASVPRAASDRERSVLQAAREKYEPGDRVERAFLSKLAGRLDASEEEIEGAMLRLAEAGRFAEFPGKALVFLDLEERKQPKDPQEIVDAVRLARMGLTLYSKESRSDRLRSLYFFMQSLNQFDRWGAARRQDHPLRKQVEVLVNNTALGILRSDLPFLRQGGSFVVSMHQNSEGEEIQELEKHLEDAFYERTRHPDRVSTELKDWLNAKYADRALGAFESEDAGNAAQVLRGLNTFREFIRAQDRGWRGVWYTAARKAEGEGETEPLKGDPSPPEAGPAEGTWRLYPNSSQAEEFIPISLDDDRYKTLNEFARNLTADAKKGKLDPLIGRIPELRQLIEILKKRRKANPRLIGPPGVGKTQIVEGLARQIVAGDVPDFLQGVNIFMLDAGALVAGTSLRGQFEERIKNLIREVQKSKGKVLLFIDELHVLDDLGDAQGASNAAQLLKNALSRGELSAIGATTWDDWRKVKDRALKRRFREEIKVEPQGAEEAVTILKGLRSRYEAHHDGVRIMDEAIQTAAEMALDYVRDNHLPDSAIDLMDRTSARVALMPASELRNGRPSHWVTPEDIKETVKSLTGMPVVYGEDLPDLEAELKGRVKGQDGIIAAIARKVRKAYRALKNPKKPMRFIFLGPPGVGKTELAKALNSVLFGLDPSSLTRIDMSEYKEAHTVSRLIGPPPGYVGFDTHEGLLTGPVRKKPFQVVLLDEVGQAHRDVHQLLLQIMEEGGITDTQGNWVDFRHVILVMTDNAGSEKEFEQAFGFAGGAQALQTESLRERLLRYMDAIKKLFSPAILSRIGDNIHVFGLLSRGQLEETLDLRLKELNRHLGKERKGMQVELTPSARSHLLDFASTQRNQELGPARQLGDAVWELIGDALLDADNPAGTLDGKRVIVDAQGGALSARIKEPGR